MTQLDSKTLVPLGAACAAASALLGGAWWLAANIATMKSDISYLASSQEAVVAKLDRLLWQEKGVSVAPGASAQGPDRN